MLLNHIILCGQSYNISVDNSQIFMSKGMTFMLHAAVLSARYLTKIRQIAEVRFDNI